MYIDVSDGWTQLSVRSVMLRCSRDCRAVPASWITPLLSLMKSDDIEVIWMTTTAFIRSVVVVVVVVVVEVVVAVVVVAVGMDNHLRACVHHTLYTTAKVTRRLQMVLNAAARLVVGTGKYDHITPALRDVLHWLPVPQRTEFKIAILEFDCVSGTGPAYFKDVCVPVSDIAARSALHSAERGDLFVPRTRTTKLSRRSFTVAAPVVWNSLPSRLRSPLISRGQFSAGLKTHLFKQAYSL